MKRIGVIALSAASVVSSGVMAQDTTVEVGKWTVITRSQPGKSPNPLCIVRSPISDGKPWFQLSNAIRLKDSGFRGNADFTIYFNKEIELSSQKIDGVSIVVDGKKSWTASGTLVSVNKTLSGLTTVLDSNVDSVIAPLAQGNVVEVNFTIPGRDLQVLKLDLIGSSKALAAFESCLSGVRTSQ